MKRVQSACLYQTILFLLDGNVAKEEALRKVDKEVKLYKENIIEGETQILSEEVKKDGTVILKVRRRVTGYPIGKYFDD